MTAIVGPRLSMNELKSIFAAEAIMIFGGSPISVAAPSIFEARAWAIINGMVTFPMEK
jgi:hypothetical protein